MTSSAEKPRRIIFVSGHLDLTEDEFAQHYQAQLYDAIAKGAYFVVGDAAGCDIMAQKYIWRNTPRLEVFHMFSSPRNLVIGCKSLRGGFTSDDERDAAMTHASSEDIAWVRPSKSKRNSGTAKNLARRIERNRLIRQDARKRWPKYVVTQSFGDAYGETHYRVRRPVPGEVAHADLAIPVDPEVYQEYLAAEVLMNDARRAYASAQAKIKALVHEQELDPLT
jgi:hypothetical protein